MVVRISHVRQRLRARRRRKILPRGKLVIGSPRDL
jgi:hypothetical protein